jgi:hypothetical protein
MAPTGIHFFSLVNGVRVCIYGQRLVEKSAKQYHVNLVLLENQYVIEETRRYATWTLMLSVIVSISN